MAHGQNATVTRANAGAEIPAPWLEKSVSYYLASSPGAYHFFARVLRGSRLVKKKVVALGSGEPPTMNLKMTKFVPLALETYGALSDRSDRFLVECATRESAGSGSGCAHGSVR